MSWQELVSEFGITHGIHQIPPAVIFFFINFCATGVAYIFSKGLDTSKMCAMAVTFHILVLIITNSWWEGSETIFQLFAVSLNFCLKA